MAMILFEDLRQTKKLNGLRSKYKNDRVNGEMKKPEFVDSGFNRQWDSGDESDSSRTTTTSTISDSPNFRNKEIGESMENLGYFIIPRSITSDYRYKSAPLKYKHVLNILFELVAFSPKTHAIGSEIIKIEVGQFCVSERKLVEICNEGVRHEEDKIQKNHVRRAIQFFEKCDFVNQQVIHGKTLLTITALGFYRNKKTTSEPACEPEVNQTRTTNEERKEREDLNNTIDEAEAFDPNLLEKEKRTSFFQNPIPTQFDEEKQKDLEALWKIVNEKKIAEGMTVKPGIKHKDLVEWLKKYEGKEIFNCINLAQKQTISKTWGGYITKLLQDRIPKKNEDSAKGRKFVENFIKENNIGHIELKDQYFKDLNSNEQSYYHLPIETLSKILNRSFQRFQEEEERDEY